MLPNLCNLSIGDAPPGRVCCPPHHVSVGSVFDRQSFADLNAQENLRDPLNPDAEDEISAFVAWAFRSNQLTVVRLGGLVRDLKDRTHFDTMIHGLSDEVAKLVVDYMEELAAYTRHVFVNVGAPWYLQNTEELTRNFARANNDATNGIKVFYNDPANNDVLFVLDEHAQETLAMMRRAYSLVRELTPDAINARWKMSVTNNVGDILQTDSSSLPEAAHARLPH